jgi:hypothetical protein
MCFSMRVVLTMTHLLDPHRMAPLRQTYLARISQCAVKGVLFPAGANPARQLSLQPEALEAVQGGNELD